MDHRCPAGIYFVGQGDSDSSLTTAKVGVKASGLAALDRLGFALPPADAISADVFRECFPDGALAPGFRPRLESALQHLEEATDLALGPRGSLGVAVPWSPPPAMAAAL